MENSNLKKKIFDEVINLGFNINHIGTRYIVEAIEMIHDSKDPNYLMSSIEKNVYYELAKKYNRNPLTVKSNITKATNYVDDMNIIKNRRNKKN